MIVAGGVYLETCIAPASTSLVGSGGRAALALTGLTPKVQLHAFQPARLADEVYPNLEPFGVDVRLYPSSGRLNFHYLHPLARPRITPIPLPRAQMAEVSGKVILRFGCLEGSFRVAGDRVVYDPQTAVAPDAFRNNGSTAGSLALVLNRAELAAAAATLDMKEGVRKLQRRDGADVVVIKSGPAGAYIFDKDAEVQQVPAFEAMAIYKIGSGDTFSAAFTYYWAIAGVSATEAARFASLHTAEYVETRRSIFLSPPPVREPMAAPLNRKALVCMGRQGASAEWLKEEVLVCLRDLGVKTRFYAGSILEAVQTSHQDEVLFLIDPVSGNRTAVTTASARGQKIIVYTESVDRDWDEMDGGLHGLYGGFLERDLSTALYRVAWA